MKPNLLFKSLLISVGAGLLGFALNAASLELVSGVHFIFGGVLPLLVAWSLGPWYGAVAGVLAGAYTYTLWHHPYAIVIFSMEAFSVGWLVRRRGLTLLEASLLYWLLLGWALVFLFYVGVLGAQPNATLLIALKQSTNGLINSILAGTVLLLTVIAWPSAPINWMGRVPGIKDYLTVLLILPLSLVFLVSIPTLGGRYEQEIRDNAAAALTRTMDSVEQILSGPANTKMLQAKEHPAGWNTILTPLLAASGQRLVLTDVQGRVTYVSDSSMTIGTPYDDRHLTRLNQHLSVREPVQWTTLFERFGKSTLVTSRQTPSGLVYLEQSLQTYDRQLRSQINALLYALLATLAVIIAVKLLIVRILHHRMEEIVTYADTVMADVQTYRPLTPPARLDVEEVDRLNANFHRMGTDLSLSMNRLVEQSRELRQALDELKSTQMQLEFQASQMARIEAYRDFVHTIGNLLTPARVAVSAMRADQQASNYLAQMLDRVRQWVRHGKEGSLPEYLSGEGLGDPEGLVRGLELLQQADENQRQGQDIINTAITRAVESTASQSRLQKELSVVESVDLAQAIRAAQGLLAESWERHGIRAELRVEAGTGPTPEPVLLNVEKVRLFNAVHNVLKNAGEALFESPQEARRIDIAVRLEKGMVELEVKDNGCGMTAEELGQAGRLGYTTKAGTGPGEGGSGVGVHNCRIFMARNGGRFSMDSPGLGQGTSVRLSFPVTMRENSQGGV